MYGSIVSILAALKWMVSFSFGRWRSHIYLGQGGQSKAFTNFINVSWIVASAAPTREIELVQGPKFLRSNSHPNGLYFSLFRRVRGLDIKYHLPKISDRLTH